MPREPKASAPAADAPLPESDATSAPTPPASPPAADAPAPEAEEIVPPAVLAKMRRAAMAFRSQEVGLPDLGAALLAAHGFATVEGAEHMGGTEWVAWAHEFMRLNPHPWRAVIVGHVPLLEQAFERYKIKTLPIQRLVDIAARIHKAG